MIVNDSSPSHIAEIATAPVDLELTVSGDGALFLSIKTERLELTPVSSSDATSYHAGLYGNPTVMEKFATGETRSFEAIEARVATWVKRWEDGNPFSALTIRTRDGEFVGQIVAGGGNEAGASEMAYLIRPEFWNQGYGTEAAQAVARGLLPVLKAYGYEVAENPLQTLEATARPDNPASGRILTKIGLTVVSEEEKHGALRQHFAGKVSLPAPDAGFEILSFSDRTVVRERVTVTKD